MDEPNPLTRKVLCLRGKSVDELHSCAGNSIPGCQSTLLHSPFHPWIPFPLSMTQTLKMNRPSNQLAIVYSEATLPRCCLHSSELLPKCPLSIPVCCTFNGGQGSHSSKGPAQKKTLAEGCAGHVCGSAGKTSCGTVREGVPPSTLPGQTTRPLALSELAEHPPTLLTYGNSNSALTHDLPRPEKSSRIFKKSCSSKSFFKTILT